MTLSGKNVAILIAPAGQASDAAKRATAEKASEMLAKGAEMASASARATAAVASDVYEDARQRIGDELKKSQGERRSGKSSA